MASDSLSHAAVSGSHENNGPAILSVAIATTITAALCVFMRIYVRTRIITGLWWDDGFIFIASTLSIAGTVFIGLCVSSGAGKHTHDLPNPLSQVPGVIKWNTAYQIDNVICVNLTKLSILLFVLRIANSKKVAYLIYLVMFSMSVVNITTVGALVSQCRPLEKLWNPTKPGKCFYEAELSRFGYGQGVVNVLTDFFCTSTPVFILWNVKIKRRLKFAISGLMSIGLAATASQIVRVIALNSLNAEDYTYQIITIVISAILDQNLGIIAACIPTFQPVFRLLAKTLKAICAKSGSSKGLSTVNSHYQISSKPTSGDTSLEAGYGEQELSDVKQQPISIADYSAAENNGESGYPLHSLTSAEGRSSEAPLELTHIQIG